MTTPRFTTAAELRKHLLKEPYYCDDILVGKHTLNIRADALRKRSMIWIAARIFDALRIFPTSIGDYKIKVTDFICYDSYLYVSGSVIHTPTGKNIGGWARSLNYKSNGQPDYVEHDEFTIYNAKHQGNGIARVWLKRSFKRYRDYGFNHVQVTAAGDNGRYTWARLGFEISDDDRDLWGKNYQQGMFKIIERARKKGTDAKTIRLARKMVIDGVPTNISMKQVATLGKTGPWRDRKKHHLGQALLMCAQGWEGRYELKKVS